MCVHIIYTHIHNIILSLSLYIYIYICIYIICIHIIIHYHYYYNIYVHVYFIRHAHGDARAGHAGPVLQPRVPGSEGLRPRLIARSCTPRTWSQTNEIHVSHTQRTGMHAFKPTYITFSPCAWIHWTCETQL